MNENQEYQSLQERKSHSSTFFPYNTYLCTIPLDFTRVPPHWHDDVELIVIKSGCGIVHVDMDSYSVRSGEIVVVRPGQIHSIYQDGDHQMEYENILFQSKLLYSSSSDLFTVQFFETYFNLAYTIPAHIHHNTANSTELYSCIEHIDSYCKNSPNNYQLFVKGYLYQFFFLLAQNHEHLLYTKNNKKLDKIKQVISYVEGNYMHDISIHSAAEELGFSESHFMKLFKANMHTTFTNYVNDYRLNKASELLRTTDDSIMKIMELVGFNNLSYFNRLFKEYYHMTPRDYRNPN